MLLKGDVHRRIIRVRMLPAINLVSISLILSDETFTLLLSKAISLLTILEGLTLTLSPNFLTHFQTAVLETLWTSESALAALPEA
jgi:uncharacterized protein YjeT (DUF2065 family)